jgi:hypothetical protein
VGGALRLARGVGRGGIADGLGSGETGVSPHEESHRALQLALGLELAHLLAQPAQLILFARRQPQNSGRRQVRLKTRELSRARAALDEGELATALYLLQEARQVAVAQRKLDELLEVRELVRSLCERSSGRTKEASERLARKVSEGLRTFPAEALASAGVQEEPERELLGPLLARRELRARAGEGALARTRELSRARAALDTGDPATALYLLQEARRVAVAQRRLNELLEVYELVQVLSERSGGRTRAASERLARKVEEGLRSFAQAGSV